MEYSFTLKVQLGSEGQDIDTLIERLAQPGETDQQAAARLAKSQQPFRPQPQPC